MPPLRRLAIVFGCFTNRLQTSDRPDVRALATCRYLPRSIALLMRPILRDCLDQVRGRFHTEAIDIYRAAIAEHYDPPDYLLLKGCLTGQAAQYCYPYDWQVLHLIKVLGLEKKDWPVV